VCWNRPSGDAIRSNWGGDTLVEIKMPEGDIVRSKGKADYYQLYRASEALDFKAFGTNVPQEIITLLNINEINFQSQLDTPFLLSETPGAVAAHFNKVARLDMIDVGLQNVQREIRALEQRVEFGKEAIEGTKASLAKFEYLDKFEAEVEVLESTEKELIALVNGRRRLIKLVEDIKRVEEMQEEFVVITAVEPIVTTILVNYSQKRMLQEEYSTLEHLVDSMGSIEQRQLRSQENAVELEEQYHRDMPDVCPLCGNKIKK